jgi:hypothetical protein
MIVFLWGGEVDARSGAVKTDSVISAGIHFMARLKCLIEEENILVLFIP